MNYFRSRFHRPTGTSQSGTSTDTESVLRDVRRRRSDALQNLNVLGNIETRKNSRDIGSVLTPTRRRFLRHQELNKIDDRDGSDAAQKRYVTSEKSVIPSFKSTSETSVNTCDVKKTATVTKSSSLRRRRREEDDDGSSLAAKKANFRVGFRDNLDTTSKIDAKQKDEEEKLLEAIEVKSAAQWKAVSQRISWNDQKDDEGQYHFSLKPLDGTVDYGTEFVPTKVQQLRLICWKVKPWKQSKVTNKLFSSQFAIGWGVDCDEVYPGLFVGDKESASNLAFLKKIGVTHVLNTAEGKDEGLVDLSQSHYDDTGITYLGFQLWDTPTCNIIPYLGCAAEFISNAIDNGGKCLVNCQMGVSRSSSCAMAYLMINKGMRATEVLAQLRQNRDIRPNDGFLEQLVSLDNDLRANRELGQERNIVLSGLADYRRLPQPWNYEFWTKPVTEEEIGLPLVKLGEPCPIVETQNQSLASSRRSSRILSRRSSRRSIVSRISSKSSRSVSRHSSFKVTESVSETDQDWEWTSWEDEAEEEDKEVNNVIANDENHDPNRLTEEKLQKVKNIIETPEEKWRLLWQSVRSCDTPSSVASSIKSSNYSNSSKLSNKIQPGPDSGDPLSSVKVGSAKDWKAISRRLTINLDGIDLNAEDCNQVEPIRPDTPCDFKMTTAQQLRLLCWRIKPWDHPRARNLFSSVLASGWGVDCDEVFPNLFIGDEASARNIKFLQKIGVTHVLNAAEGKWTDCSFVDLDANYYEGSGIVYQGVQLWDSSKVRILPYFGCFDEFISKALKSGGKCLVHCQMGVSRSCTAAMVYMMLSEGWNAIDVLTEFRKRRDVRPNDHFLAQVAELDNDLRKERLFEIPRKLKLHRLSDLESLPKPWHYEFWDTQPDPDTLPFTLCHMSEDSKLVGKSIDDPIEEKKETSEKEDHESSSEWEWEYYDDSDDDQEEREGGKEDNQKAVEKVSVDCAVGSARQWREMSVKLWEGSIVIDDEDDESEEGEAEKLPKPTKAFEPTLERHLRLICWKVKPWMAKKSSKMFSSQFAMLWNVDVDEVHPNLYIGDQATAKNIKFLKHLNITNVLNAAQGQDDNLVDLSPEYFIDSGISYKGFLMWDSDWFDVAPFITEAVDFIDQALANGEKCLVNCQMGVSRSSTCALAYMMLKLGYTACDALRTFRHHRDVRPNDGFMKYLVHLDNKLRRQREGYDQT